MFTLRRALLLASVFVIALVLAYFAMAPERRRAAENANRSTAATTVPEPTVPKRVYSWQGTVRTVEADGLTFATRVTDPATKKAEEKTYTVTIAATTTILAWDLSTPEQANAGGRKVDAAELKAGDTITVQSESEADAEGVITATTINKIIQQ